MYSYRHLVSVKGKLPYALNSAYWWLVVYLLVILLNLELRSVGTVLYSSDLLIYTVNIF
jgi:hypothetical protein